MGIRVFFTQYKYYLFIIIGFFGNEGIVSFSLLAGIFAGVFG